MAVDGAEPFLVADAVTLAYDSRTVSVGLDVGITEGEFTVILGPNACGKSTLLRALSRLIRPSSGRILLDGSEIHQLPSKELARRMGLLPQGAQAPEGITVGGLVARGRFPHQSLLRQWSEEDQSAVISALARTGMTDLVDRRLDELSGGQRQRVWIAMALAQETPILVFGLRCRVLPDPLTGSPMVLPAPPRD
ncbi:ABC transporter ATP-binding protein [Naumannella halotolerans]|uniref:ABC transporter family protein n=1 Tax=Naumannella halotolerans TaxID=993414 RepID=A0A4R7JCA7_9ACTN|nr:ABC transporter ATP-binding protein [Naumannella halotolerans]TDT34283.1 ABC transporter family protein [Naumannella halotolerans]